MNIALYSEHSLATCSHVCQALPDKIWFWIIVCVTEDVGDGERVGGH